MGDTPPADLKLFTSLRYDPELILTDWNERSPLFLVRYHIKRLQDAAETFNWDKAKQVTIAPDFASKFKAQCKRAVQSYTGDEQAIMIRMLLSRDGELTTETLPLEIYPFDLLALAHYNPDKEQPAHPAYCRTAYLDSVATPSSQYTSTKTTSRGHYDAARARAGITSRAQLKEVILYNGKGEITEGSVSNVSFWREGKWVTPSLESGCLPGTVRAWLIDHGLLSEAVIEKDSLRDGEYVLLHNGANGIQPGKISLSLVRESS